MLYKNINMNLFDNFSFDFDLIMNKVNENINWFYDYISIPYKHSEVIKVFNDEDIENKYEKLAIAGLIFTSNFYVKTGLIFINVSKIIAEEVYTFLIYYEKEFVLNLQYNKDDISYTEQYNIDGRKMNSEEDEDSEESIEEEELKEEEKEDNEETKWDQPLDGEIQLVETEEVNEQLNEEKQEVNSSSSWFGFGSKEKVKGE